MLRLLCGLLLTSLIVRSQNPESPVIRVNVQQVLIPVIVTDSKGHHVTGLKASDFHIEEDGVEQKIAAFSTDSAPSAAAMIASAEGDSVPAEPAGARRSTFVICIDALHSSFANSARTRQALSRLFEKEKSDGAQYVVLSIGRQLQMLQTATTDPAVVFGKLRNPAAQNAMGGGDAASLTSELNDLTQRMYGFCKRCQCDSARECDAEATNLKLQLDSQGERWAAMGRQFLGQLKSVVEELAKLPTGRTLVLISDGFAVQPAREFYGVAASFLPKDQRFKLAGGPDLEPELQTVMKVAAARNVRIYSVDSRAVEQTSFSSGGSMDASKPEDTAPPSVIRHTAPANRGGTLLSDMDHHAASVAFQNGSGMEELARATGGVFLHDSNDMVKQLRSVLADGREYYLLAYQSTNAAQDGKFRAVTVEVRDQKLHVRAKPGYWASPSMP